MTFDQLDFSTYCLGALSEHLNISQPEVYMMLKRSGILDNYIVPGYDVLHTFSHDYLVNDITELMKEKGLI